MKKYTTFILIILICIQGIANTLSIEGNQFHLNGKPFKMWGIRVASASQGDSLTDRLIANLDEYKASGINTISVFAQGSSGAYSDAFLNNGLNIDSGHLHRIEKIIKACDERSMVVIVGIFYQRVIANMNQSRKIHTRESILNATRTITLSLIGYKNIIINIANEQNSFYYREFKEFDFNNPENIILLCEEVKKTDSTRIVGGGGYKDSTNVVIGKSEYVDVLLFDTDEKDVAIGHTSGWHYDYFRIMGVPDKPIVNVEIFGAWSGQFMPQGVYTDEGKKTHEQEIIDAKIRQGLYVHFHSNPWCQGGAYKMMNRFDLGGLGTLTDPGIRWFFSKIHDN